MFTCSFKVLTASSNILRKWWIGVSSVGALYPILPIDVKKNHLFSWRASSNSLCACWLSSGLGPEMLEKQMWFWGKVWFSRKCLRKKNDSEERFSPLDRKRRGWGCMMALSRWSPGRHLKKVFFWKVFVQRCFLHDPGSLTLPVNNNIQTAFNYICNVQEDETLVS